MDSPIKNIDELLSGMLDGMLSDADLVELKREMDENPSLKGRLDELAALRRLLLSGRSTRSLRPDFASSITLGAKKRAAEMGSDAPAWLASADSLVPFQKSLAPSSFDSVPWGRWVFAGSLALAATLLFVMLSIPKADPVGIVSFPDGDEKNAIVDIAVTPEAPGTIEVPDSKKLLDEKPEKILVAELESTPHKSKNELAESVARVETVKPNPTPLNTRPADAVVVNLKDQSTEKSSQKQTPFYTMVVDVSIDPTALENRALERILEKYNIVYTDDLVISEAQLKNLEDSKMVGIVANSEEKMGVMFLRSSARQLDLAVREVMNQFEDFPDVVLDLSTDESVKMLVKQLSSIKVAGGSDGYAKRLSLPKAPGNRSPFAASSRRNQPMSRADREKSKSGIVLGMDVGNDLSNVLLLLRSAKK